MLTLQEVLHHGVRVLEQLIQQELPGVVVEYLRQVPEALHHGVHPEYREAAVHVLRRPAIQEVVVLVQAVVALIQEAAADQAVVEAIAAVVVAPVVVVPAVVVPAVAAVVVLPVAVVVDNLKKYKIEGLP